MMSAVFKKYLFLFLKISLSVFLLWFLFSQIDASKLKETLVESNQWFIILAFCINAVGICLGVQRWKMLLNVQGILVSYRKLLSINLSSAFLGMFLPSGFGGDVIRGYDLFKHSKQGVVVASSIMVERLFGLLSLLTIGGFALVIGYKWFNESSIIIGIIIVYASVIVLLVLLFNRRVFDVISSLISRFSTLSKVLIKVRKFIDAMEKYKGNTRVLVLVFLISLFMQTNGIFYYYIISLSLSIEVSFWPFFAIMPIVWIATMAPFTAGGLGVKEGMFMLLLTNLGVAKHQALLLSLIGTAIYIPFAGIGAVVFILKKRNTQSTDGAILPSNVADLKMK